ncbi:unnamed protein product [Rotaria magnacalcarata]|uniref:Uncharacterized protein n=2 Tax=Rotaria magnacalcarata TaxID=392030 RepID=A0A820BGG9_9BILA|nr:unnamed protein product [Rotaria magnacalcarata]CAF2085567.1 unnamed protein product [Rotaria magnacalcarata]CAF3883394.1 unnamed protein product [Rotaria magnacalcarata]CAF4205956.1 unnamed protein product [Rotaria magnacalcarata]
MLFNLQILELCASGKALRTPLNLRNSVKHYAYGDFEKLNEQVATHSNTSSFIVLLNLNDQNSHVDLDYLKEQDCVLTIFLCGNLTYDSQDNHGKIYPVQKEVIASKIKSAIIQFLRSTAAIRLSLGDIIGSQHRISKAHSFERQNFTDDQAVPCHVLIIPLNASIDNLLDVQQRLLQQCNCLCPDYEPTVCTIYDYLPQNENGEFDRNPDAALLCNHVKLLSLIRVYLIGNEEYIQDSMCKYFFQYESHATNLVGYNATYTLIENEPIGANIMNGLNRIINVELPATRVIKQLREIADDPHFYGALESSNANLERRERLAIRSVTPENRSSNYHRNTQAEAGPIQRIESASDEDIDTKILK